MAEGTCSVDDCDRPILAKGMCSLHYNRMRLYGRLEKVHYRRQCECGKPAVAFGLCDLHYRRTKADGKKATSMQLKEGRACRHCGGPISPQLRLDALFCSRACKVDYQNNHARRDGRTEAEAARMRAYHYTRKFGMTAEDFDRMLAEQDGRCAICGTDTPGGRGEFCIDHCHVSGEVRGILCSRCNTGLGQFQDDPARLLAAVKYLESGTV